MSEKEILDTRVLMLIADHFAHEKFIVNTMANYMNMTEGDISVIRTNHGYYQNCVYATFKILLEGYRRCGGGMEAFHKIYEAMLARKRHNHYTNILLQANFKVYLPSPN